MELAECIQFQLNQAKQIITNFPLKRDNVTQNKYKWTVKEKEKEMDRIITIHFHNFQKTIYPKMVLINCRGVVWIELRMFNQQMYILDASE